MPDTGLSPHFADAFRDLLDRSPDLLFRYRIVEPRAFVWVSAAAEALTGYTPDAFLSDPGLWHRLVPPGEPAASMIEALAEADPRLVPSRTSLRILRADGAWRDVELDLGVEWAEDDTPLHVLGLVRDVSARAERERLAAVVAQAAEAIFTVDASCTVLTWNAGAERLLGIPAGEAIGHRGPLAVSDEERAELRERGFLLGEAITLPDARFLGADGHEIPVSVSATPIRGADGGVEALSVIARDERPRIEADRELRFREAVLGAVDDAVLVTDADGWVVFWSAGAERMTGIPADEAVGRQIAEVMPYRTVNTSRAELAHRLMRGLPVRDDLEITRRDGRLMIGDLTSSEVTGPDGRSLRLGVIRDVTQAREAARDLSRLAAIVGAANEIIFSMDADAVVRSWNPGAERVLGYEAAAIIGRTIAALVEPAQLPAVLGMHERVTRGGEGAVTGDLVMLARDASQVPVGITVSPIREATGKVGGVAVIAQDQRRRQAVEGQLRQAKKLEALGRLTSGIGHDFNNLLTAVTGYGSLLLADLPETSAAAADARQILQAADRAAELTRSLLALSSDERFEARLVQLETLVTSLEPSLGGMLPAGVRLWVDAAAPAHVMADPTELELALVNLVINAGEAMPSGGRVELTVRPVLLDDAFAANHLGVTAGPHAELVVKDNGPGLPPHVQEHIFEPYTTTKEGETGAGLGLATVHAYVERAGGTIWFTTSPGRGTEFRILLPLVAGAPQPVAPPTRRTAQGGTERILIVEDDTQVRALASTILGRAGYQLTARGDPRQALDVDPGSFDLLLSDVLMPNMNGPQLAEALRERRPDLPVLFMSGFSDRTDVDDVARHSSQPLLAKPFGPAELLAAVRRALDAPPAPPSEPPSA